MSFYGAEQGNPFAEEDNSVDDGQPSTSPPATTAVAGALEKSAPSSLKRPREDGELELQQQQDGTVGLSTVPPGQRDAQDGGVPEEVEEQGSPSGAPVSGYAYDDEDEDGENEDDEENEQRVVYGEDDEVQQDGAEEGGFLQTVSAPEGQNELNGAVTDTGVAGDEQDAEEEEEAQEEQEQGREPSDNEAAADDNEEDDDDNDEEAEEDDSDGLREVMLKVSELEAMERASSGRYSIKLRLAEAEADAVREFIQAQQDALDAAERAWRTPSSSTSHSNRQSVTEKDIGDKGERRQLTTAEVRARLALEPRVAAALQRLAQATVRLTLLEARVAQLRWLLPDNPASARASEKNATAPSGLASDDVETLLWSSVLSQPKEECCVPVEPLHALQSSGWASASSPSPTAALPLSRQELESALLAKKLLSALAYITDGAKRTAIEQLLAEVERVRGHSHDLVRYTVYLAERTAAAERVVRASYLHGEEWGLMAAHVTCGGDLAQLSSATAMAEDQAMRENTRLQERLQSLQAALAALVASTVSSSFTAGPSASRTATAAAAVLPSEKEEAAVAKEIAQLAALKDGLVREVLFLRKQAREAGYGDGQLTGPERHSLLVDAGVAKSRTRSMGDQSATAGPVLTSLLQELAAESHRKVQQLAQRLVGRSDGSIHGASTDEGEEEEEKELARLESELLDWEGKVALRHRSAAALLAANARLAEEIRSVAYVDRFATVPESASQLANVLLLKLGFPPARTLADEQQGGRDEDGAQEEETEGRLSLPVIERHVLALHRERVQSLLDTTSEHLARVEAAWLQPELAHRAQMAHLLRLLALKDTADLAELGCPAPSTSPLTETIETLESKVVSDLSSASSSCALAMRPVPLLPATNARVQETVGGAVCGALDATSAEWAALQKACHAAREELSWYGQFAVEDVATLLAQAQEEKKTLLQRTLDAGKRSKAAKDEQQLAERLVGEIAALEQAQRPPREARLAALSAELQRAQTEYECKKIESDLAREAAEAERQLREQAEQEAELARQRQAQQHRQEEKLADLEASEGPPEEVEGFGFTNDEETGNYAVAADLAHEEEEEEEEGRAEIENGFVDEAHLEEEEEQGDGEDGSIDEGDDEAVNDGDDDVADEGGWDEEPDAHEEAEACDSAAAAAAAAQEEGPAEELAEALAASISPIDVASSATPAQPSPPKQGSHSPAHDDPFLSGFSFDDEEEEEEEAETVEVGGDVN